MLPYQLVAMLFQKLLDNIATAKGAIAQKNHAKKGEQISNAIAIIGVLEGIKPVFYQNLG